MKQYLPMKPVQRGIKIWVRSDCRNGYIYVSLNATRVARVTKLKLDWVPL